MYSEFIQSKIEEQIEKKIISSNDCTRLSLHIFEKTNFKLSATTLEALFGINSRRMEPSLFTAEVLANYLGYTSSAHLRSEFNQRKFEQINQPEVNEHLPYTSTCVSA
jgi:hypothetical protein